MLPPFTTAGGHGSPYLALVVLFPSAAPLIRRLAMLFPDAKLRKWIQVGGSVCSYAPSGTLHLSVVPGEASRATALAPPRH